MHGGEAVRPIRRSRTLHSTSNPVPLRCLRGDPTAGMRRSVQPASRRPHHATLRVARFRRGLTFPPTLSSAVRGIRSRRRVATGASQCTGRGDPCSRCLEGGITPSCGSHGFDEHKRFFRRCRPLHAAFDCAAVSPTGRDQRAGRGDPCSRWRYGRITPSCGLHDDEDTRFIRRRCSLHAASDRAPPRRRCGASARRALRSMPHVSRQPVHAEP